MSHARKNGCRKLCKHLEIHRIPNSVSDYFNRPTVRHLYAGSKAFVCMVTHWILRCVTQSFRGPNWRNFTKSKPLKLSWVSNWCKLIKISCFCQFFYSVAQLYKHVFFCTSVNRPLDYWPVLHGSAATALFLLGLKLNLWIAQKSLHFTKH